MRTSSTFELRVTTPAAALTVCCCWLANELKEHQQRRKRPVIIESRPLVNFTVQYPCLNRSTFFTSNASNIFGTIINQAWNFGDGSSSSTSSATHQFNPEGNYNVSLTANTQYGCSTTLSKPVAIIKPFAFAGRDTIALYEQPHQLMGSGTGIYSWSPSNTLNNAQIFNPIALLRNDETYELTIVTPEGCIATDKVNIKVIIDFNVYVPSAFTPNGDGKNDVLKAFPLGIKTFSGFTVYNRYGQRVFSSTDPGKGWDGTINGIRQETGVFVWIVEATDIFGRAIKKKGSTLLIN